MKNLQLIFLVVIILAGFSFCGSGMNILFKSEKTGYMTMDYSFDPIDVGMSTYTVDVVGYFEPNAKCGNMVIEDVFWQELIVWKISREWGELKNKSKLMENGYFGLIQDLLHEKYLNLLCGE